MKKALITGVTGQDGSYLAEFLLNQGYQVFGLIRRNSDLATSRIDHIYEQISWDRSGRFQTFYADMTDGVNLSRILSETLPDEIYNFAAQSHVKISFEIPEYTANVNGLSVLRFLEAIRLNCPNAKFYQAGTSEMFGNLESPQLIQNGFSPQSPYASAKCFAHSVVENYRNAYGLHTVNGVVFNHESPRRGKNFVTKKIVDTVYKIKNNEASELRLGNLQARRDWGYAPEYVVAIWKLLNLEEPINSTIATGVSGSVQEFANYCFELFDLNPEDYLVSNTAENLRINEVHDLRGEPKDIESKINTTIKIKWKKVCEIMVENALSGKRDEVEWNDFI
jgi:GDPmannose 4,6-dehydratase